MIYGTATTGIKALFYELTKTNSSSISDAILNIYTQPAEDEIVALLAQSDGRWQYDDNNYSDFPTATGTLVSGQQDYSLTTAHLRIEGVAVKTQQGIWRRLLPFDPASDLNSSSTPFTFVPLVNYGPTMDRAEFLKAPGMPQFYDIQGASILLYPAPDNGISVTLASGLKLYYHRGPLHFDWTLSTFTDGTGATSSSPGYNSLFHDLIAYMAAYDYCVANTLTPAAGFANKIAAKKALLVKTYASRNQDERKIMSGSRIRYI